MTLLHPWAIGLGVAAIALPVLIHWLTRPRPLRLPLSTVRFVMEAVRQRRARHRLRDIIILTLRTLAVGCLAWAFARPLLGERPLISGAEATPTTRVVVLDQSQSMGACVNGIALFERARPIAARYVSYRQGLKCNLVFAGARAEAVMEAPSENFATLGDELARTEVRPERLDIQAAVTLAAGMLANAPSGSDHRRELIIVSDFQRTNWARADFSPLPDDALIQLESVAPAERQPNLAILAVRTRGRAEGGQDLRLEVDVGNYSATPRSARVEVNIGGTLYTAAGTCPPAQSTTLGMDVRPGAAGWQSGEARLLDVQDALAADDVRPFVLQVHPAASFLLVSRQPGDLAPSSSFYLRCALDPFGQAGVRAGKRVVQIDPAALDRDSAATADMLVVDHPGKLSSEAIGLLASLVRRGRALLYVVAEPVDAANLKLLAEAAGSDLQMPVEFGPPPAERRRRDLFLTDVRKDAAPFRVFGDQLWPALSELRFAGGLVSRRTEAGMPDEILATFNDRSACLVVTECGAGSAAVLNVDLQASNLPASPAFVPLMAELIDRMLGSRRLESTVACGESLGLFLPPETGGVAGLQVTGPDGAAGQYGELLEEPSGVFWRWRSVGRPGVYGVRRDDAVIASVAAAIPGEESDLQSLSPDVLKERLAGGRRVEYQVTSPIGEERDRSWMWLATMCAACLIGEVVVLRIFRT